ncbi:hypothetical protein GGP79_002367 [Salinibacter ruber]|uniref:hypothetical protein n=1 Tax=Salinibacter ruber TaxID=146919 RepID=UPI00216A00B6|nr:hypothetical protein [Salinibacter ruber]MCS3754403.1 hypothetical protein [Salinibacter ruber]
MRQLLRITATFALALVFSAGMAFGQQDGEPQEDPGDFNNFTFIEQASDGNVANVEQQGADNTVLLPGQGGEFGSSTFRAEAEIEQVGDENYVGVNQGGNSKVGESFLDVYMEGNNNFIGNQSGGIANQQGGVLEAEMIGSNNEIGIAAEQQNSKAFFDIEGSNNMIDMFQKSWGGAEKNQQEFDATITGSGNTVDLFQGDFGHSLGNRANLLINGSTNDVSIRQGVDKNTFPPPGSPQSNYNYAEVSVNGNNNVANVTQGADPLP